MIYVTALGSLKKTDQEVTGLYNFGLIRNYPYLELQMIILWKEKRYLVEQ